MRTFWPGTKTKIPMKQISIGEKNITVTALELQKLIEWQNSIEDSDDGFPRRNRDEREYDSYTCYRGHARREPQTQ